MSKYNNEYVKGVLKTQGTRFVNGEGQEIILHGYGTANWENVEGFMIGGVPTPIDIFKFFLFPGPGRDHHPPDCIPDHPGALRQPVPLHLLGPLGGEPPGGSGHQAHGGAGLQLRPRGPERQRPSL